MAVVEALGLASSLAQTLLTALQNIEVRELCSMFHCETQFMKLKNTLSTINALLHDIDAMRQGLTDEGQDWIEKLKDAVYEIDDLLDEFATIGQQRKQMQDAYFFQKVPTFFSRNNKYLVDFNMSREMRRLREMLADITKDHYSCYSLDQTTKHAVTRLETSSRLSELKIVGRKNDKETVLHKLLLDSSPSDYSTRFVCIVGMGGLGKTTLAQPVYNDNEVQKAFSPRIWVCVSEQFGPKEILGKILEKEVSNLEAAQREVRTLLESKRYLLVLDDVWNESHGKWRDGDTTLASESRGMGSRTFFPALEKLELYNMPMLMGWRGESRWRVREGEGGGCFETVNAVSFPVFPRLYNLKIVGCESMAYFPPCVFRESMKH